MYPIENRPYFTYLYTKCNGCRDRSGLFGAVLFQMTCETIIQNKLCQKCKSTGKCSAERAERNSNNKYKVKRQRE